MSFFLKNLKRKISVIFIAVLLSGIVINVTNINNKSQESYKTVGYNFSVVDSVFATGSDEVNPIASAPAASTSSGDNQVMTDLVKLLNSLMSVMYFILVPLISLAGWLLSPDWTMGDIFNLRPILHNIWILVSNVVYVIFAFILIAMAFMNIFGSGNKTYEMKSALPKLVIGIIIVPFTWFIVSGTLSVANILTASVLQLPSESVKGTTGENYLQKMLIPNAVYINLSGTGGFGTGTVDSNGDKKATGDPTLDYKANGMMYSLDCSGNGQTEVDGSKNPVKGGDDCISVYDLLNSGNSAYQVLYGYAYGIFEIQKYQSLSESEITKIVKNVGDVSEKLIFGTITFLAFGVIVIALVAALFMRAIALWAYIVFSPLFALGYFFDGKVPGMDKMKGLKINITEFIGLALVPVFVGAGLAFGLMFLSLVVNFKADTSGNSVATFTGGTNPNQSVIGIGGFKLITIGSPGETNKPVFSGALDIGKSLIGKVIVDFIAIILLWMIVKVALASSEITKKVSEPIFKFGETLAKSTPILPGGMSVGALQRSASIPQQALETKIANQVSPMQQKIYEKFGVSGMTDHDVREFKNKLSIAASKEDMNSLREKLKNFTSQYGRENTKVKELELEFAKKLDQNANLRTGLGIPPGVKFIKDGKVVEGENMGIGYAVTGDVSQGRLYEQEGKNPHGYTPTAAGAATVLAVTDATVVKLKDQKTVTLKVGNENVTVNIVDNKATIEKEHKVDGQVPEVKQIKEQLAGLEGNTNDKLTVTEIKAVAEAIHEKVKKK